MSENNKKTWQDLQQGDVVYKFMYCREFMDKMDENKVRIEECVYKGNNYSNDKLIVPILEVPGETNWVNLHVYKTESNEIPVCKFGEKEFYCNRADSSLFYYDKLFSHVYATDKTVLDEFITEYLIDYFTKASDRIRRISADILVVDKLFKKFFNKPIGT